MAHYNAYNRTNIVLSAIFGPLALLSVVLRLAARARSKGNFGNDDWFAIIGLLCFLIFMGMLLWGTS